MRTIGIVNVKGGSGKTTLAVHLAAHAAGTGKRTVLIDTDPQGSAAWWGQRRREAEINNGELGVIAVDAARLSEALAAAAAKGIDVCVIDTPPTNTGEARTTAALSDLVLVPVAPGVLDAISLRDTILMLREKGANAYAVINRARTNSKALTEEVRALVAPELPLWEGVIHDRIDYMKALSRGMTAPEFASEGEHKREIADLWAWAVKKLAAPSRRNRATPAAPEAEADNNIAALQRMARKARGAA